ncbi:MAG: GH36-type glycosyl hydrolase domain-containing protein, partial [Anaerolineales bacterium]
YRYNNAPLDVGGRYLYIRDNYAADHGNEDFFWSPTWQPVRTPLDDFQCRHGLGYTNIVGIKKGIRSAGTYFIPLEQDFEIWHFKISNLRTNPASLTLFSGVEFCLWDAWDDQTNFQRNLSIGEVEVENGVIYHKTEYRERRNHYAFLACSAKLAGYETQREAFLGPYRGWDAPLAVELGQTSRSLAGGWQPVGVQQIDLTLEPGQEYDLVVMLGYQEIPDNEKFSDPDCQVINKQPVSQKTKRFLNMDYVENSLKELRRYWDDLLAVLQVDTPDQHTNRMVNIWNQYQVMATFNFSRSASYFESGIGRGMGFRDSNQDLLGFVHLIPDRARERLLDLAATQKDDGSAYHQYQPLTKRGNDAVGSGFNDDPLWLVLAAAAYLKETGDWAILDALVPFDNQPGTEASLYEHLERSIQFTLDRLGPHQLPLIGRADWNDCLNLNCYSTEPGESFQTTTNKPGMTAESVFIGGLFILSAREMAEIAECFQGKGSGLKYSAAADEMEGRIWQHGWDGDWFLRAFDDSGNPVGSQTCQEGKIFVEPQGICIMAGLGIKDGKAQKALASVHKHLATEHGIILQQPAYSRYYLNLGEISSYPPGYKENAGIFCHTNPWIMIAEALVGNANRALDYYLRINPSAREEISDIHRCEPYVYAQMIAGRDAVSHGEAKNSWLTGTAAWNFVAISQWILGIRPDFQGLIVEPSLPEEWQGFKAVRLFRGHRLQITVRRAGPGSTVKVMLDGQEMPSNIIPADLLDGSGGQIDVLVGSSR